MTRVIRANHCMYYRILVCSTSDRTALLNGFMYTVFIQLSVFHQYIYYGLDPTVGSRTTVPSHPLNTMTDDSPTANQPPNEPHRGSVITLDADAEIHAELIARFHEETGTNIEDLPPLARSIDPAILEDLATTENPGLQWLSFNYAGYEIHINDSLTTWLRPREPQRSPL